MSRRTIYIGNPAKIYTKLDQLKISQNGSERASIPIEDLGYLFIDHYGISITHGALERLLESNVAIVTTNANHLPIGIFLPLIGSSNQTMTINHQIRVKKPTHKNLWKQIVKAKIKNQAKLLELLELPADYLHKLYPRVLSNDESNREAVAAKYYWTILFDPLNFKRHREGKPPNNLLNYGYAVLRAIITRAIVSTGLLPQLGIHHHNQYDPFPLADDLMEPYRPFVDRLVYEITQDELDISILRPDIKRKLLEITTVPVRMKKERKPLMLSVSITTASLRRCYLDNSKSLIFPELCG